MIILVLNCGSSSFKYQLINVETKEVLSKGLCERVGMEGTVLKHEYGGNKTSINFNGEDNSHKAAIKRMLNLLSDAKYGVLKDLKEIGAVGHRVVHGGETYSKSTLVTKEAMEEIKRCIPLAPLHNPANIAGIEAIEEILKGTPNVAVFDTAFHQTMPKKAFMYALPYEWYEELQVRRYGFHGTSHSYISKEAATFCSLPIESSRIITAHLGNGSSICALKNGVSVDTSMGLTPLEGLIMGTRCGDIDPAIIEFMANAKNMTAKEITKFLNSKSGLLGISKLSNDVRDIVEAAPNNELAALALEMFCYRIAKYIGSYMVALGGLDILVFSAGIGENSRDVIQGVVSYLGFLNTELDASVKVESKKKLLSTKGSKVKVCIIPTNEELMIANDTFNEVSAL